MKRNEKADDQNVKIRSYQPGDIGYVAYLHGKIYEETYGFGQTFEYYVLKGLTEFLESPEGGGLWIAEVNGEIAGSIAITQYDQRQAQLRWFIMAEHHQGLGIGKKLMDQAIVYCKESGYERVFLWTVNTLEAARYLYQKYGFQLLEEKTNETWTDDPLVEELWNLDFPNQMSLGSD
ncbi:MAG TPA: GNAT family N-acetyltransferase [Bacillales bacterium]|nr:GNAT family N-acetyltransferase [Bacillales bacterium]